MSCPVCCIEESPERLDEEYAEFLDREYENNMLLENNGTGKVYGWEEDIPF